MGAGLRGARGCRPERTVVVEWGVAGGDGSGAERGPDRALPRRTCSREALRSASGKRQAGIGVNAAKGGPIRGVRCRDRGNVDIIGRYVP